MTLLCERFLSPVRPHIKPSHISEAHYMEFTVHLTSCHAVGRELESQINVGATTKSQVPDDKNPEYADDFDDDEDDMDENGDACSKSEPKSEPTTTRESGKLSRTVLTTAAKAAFSGNEPRIYLARAGHDYAGDGESGNDLAFAEGALIEVISDFIEDLGEGWSMGRLGGQPSSFGFFPAAYVVRPSPDPLPVCVGWAFLQCVCSTVVGC